MASASIRGSIGWTFNPQFSIQDRCRQANLPWYDRTVVYIYIYIIYTYLAQEMCLGFQATMSSTVKGHTPGLQRVHLGTPKNPKLGYYD